MKDYETFDLGDVKLLSGKNLKSAKITYKTYGALSKNSDNVIVLPTFYTGPISRIESDFFGSIVRTILSKRFLSARKFCPHFFRNGWSVLLLIYVLL